MSGRLPDGEVVTAIANAYYDLIEQREQLSRYLTPVDVGEWLVDGRCEWCPTV